jgi:hypothetical protein
VPQPLRYRQRIEVELLPPHAFVAALMEFTVVSTAEWHSELIADFASKCALLCELKMMSIRRATPASQAGLSAYELQMAPIAQSKLFAKRGDKLLSCFGWCFLD